MITRLHCSICGSTTDVAQCGPGWLCEPCAEQNRTGRDQATRRAKLMQKSLNGRAEIVRLDGAEPSDQAVYDAESAALLALDDPPQRAVKGAGGEAVPQDGSALFDTMRNPTATALDASAERLRLISQVGVEATAMALDMSDSMGASDSVSRALAHQMGALHAASLNFLGQASLAQNPDQARWLANMSFRAMDTFRQAALAVKKLRSGGEQRIVIQHLDARNGGMVAIAPTTSTGHGDKS